VQVKGQRHAFMCFIIQQTMPLFCANDCKSHRFELYSGQVWSFASISKNCEFYNFDFYRNKEECL